jgi:hypothetical protein
MDVRSLISGPALAIVMAGTPTIVSAQATCLDYAPLRSVMEENGVRLEGVGYIDLGNGVSTAIEIWLSPDTQWAVLAVDENGIACILLSGAGWIKPERL